MNLKTSFAAAAASTPIWQLNRGSWCCGAVRRAARGVRRVPLGPRPDVSPGPVGYSASARVGERREALSTVLARF